jgi:hypothetical protein
MFPPAERSKLFPVDIYIRVDGRDPPTGQLASGVDGPLDGRPFFGWLDLLRTLSDVMSEPDGDARAEGNGR